MKISNYIFLPIFLLIIACEGNQVVEQVSEEKADVNESILALTEEQIKRAGIELGEAELRSLSNEIAFVGYIEVPPENLHSIHAPIGGFVKSVPVIEGDKVRKGQVLTTISHPDIILLQQDYIKEWSRLKFLEAELSRQQELLEGQATAAKKLESAKSEFDIQKAMINGIESFLKLVNISPSDLQNGMIKESVNIISPANGTVSLLNINSGKLMEKNELMIEVIDREHLHIELQIFEKDISKISIDQNFEFYIPGNNETFEGEVYLIGQRVDPVRKTVMVHGHPKIENERFISGMQIRGKIKLNEREVWSLPKSAVVIDENKAFVYMVKNDGFHRLEIDEIGQGNEEYVELLKPYPGMIVLEGTWFLESLFRQE